MNWPHNCLLAVAAMTNCPRRSAKHLEEKIADLMDRGVMREEAERAACREFGNVTLIGERSREVWQWPRVESLWGMCATR